MRLLFVLVALIGLVGCVETAPPLTPQEQVYELERDFSDLVARVRVYVSQPECTAAVVVACAEPKAVDAMADAARATRDAILAAETAVRANAAGSPADYVAYVNLARQGLAQLSAEMVKRGVK